MADLILVLGMHRSGTSAFSGILQQYGVGFGWMRKPGDVEQVHGVHKDERNAFNPRGNRENRPLRWLHESLLERAGGSWWDPPASVEVTDEDRRERDEVINTFEGDPIAVKDPRLLLVMDLWRDLSPKPIGVIRNPVAVRDSLEKRSRQKRPDQQRARQANQPVLDPERWEALWCTYNRVLLAEHEREPFPLVDFDRGNELDAQARAALEAQGIEAEGASTFYDPGLASDWTGWRERALLKESIELWDRLAERVGARL